MTDRTYRLIFGSLMLIFLYFNLTYLVFILIGIMIIEGITNLRISLMISRLRGLPPAIDSHANTNCKINIEAERIWRLIIGLVFLVTYAFLPEILWFVPWFLAFVIFGAGASDVCPGLAALRKAGLR